MCVMLKCKYRKVNNTASIVVSGGGLGHLAIKFLKAWGCEVTAFSSNPEKENEVRQF